MPFSFRLLLPAVLCLVVPAWCLDVLAAEPPKPTTTADTVIASSAGPLAAFRFVFQVGSQDDPKGKEGLAALTAAMVAEGGTQSLRYDQVLEKFYPIAAGLSGRCLKEVSVFSGTVHRDNLGVYIPLATEMIASPRFAPEDFDRLRKEALDYVTKTLRGDNDEELGKWTLQTALYEGHPYGHPDRGTVAGLNAITLDDVKAFHRDRYTRQALCAALAGAVDESTSAQVEKGLAPLPREGTGRGPELPPVKPTVGLDVTIVGKAAESTAISIGFPIDVTRADDDFYALAVANSYLGEHRTFNGKLMQDLRGHRGLNYGDYSYIEDFIQEGASTFAIPNNPRRQQYFSIWIRPVPRDKAVFALRAGLWELDRLVDKGMSPEDFESTRSFLLNYSKLWGQTLSRRLGYLVEGRRYGRKDLIAELAERLPKLTVEQVNAAVRKHLKPPGMKVAIVDLSPDDLRRVLMSGDQTPITYDTQGTPENILAEDKQIAVFPLPSVRVRIVPASQMFEK
ncbi:MAG: pitrilysin family protein [Paludisphaera borealis]|uniref:M16 family metallopeptidase n=1 Tax=Paludisphaera borealis TaxID=1387353 RepID=UPI00284A6744|nr:pitrilysin family protein [Paludisphaera borealis]MDR3621941.1 pitrilysin family protein [Paludisphaera borealis]